MVIVCSQYDAQALAKYFDSSSKAKKTMMIVWAKFGNEKGLIEIWRDLVTPIVSSMTSQPTTTIMIENLVNE